MKMPVQKAAPALIALAILSIGSRAAAVEPADFRSLYEITTGDTVTDLAVTPDDRYVLALSKEARTLQFIDAWDFTLLGGTTARVIIGDPGEQPRCLAVSPDGDYAYVGTSLGKVAIIKLSPIYDLLPYQDLTTALEITYATISSSAAITTIAALPEVNDANDDVYLLIGTATQLYWAKLSGGSEFVNKTAWGTSNQPLALAQADTYGFDLYKDGAIGFFQSVSCQSTVGCGPAQTFPLNLGTDSFAGLAVDPVDYRFAVTENLTTGELWLISTVTFDGMLVKPPLTGMPPTDEVALLSGTTERYEQVFTAFGHTVAVSELNGESIKFTGQGAWIVDSAADFSALSASSGADGYVYAGTTAHQIYVVSANPLIDGLTLSGGNTVTATDGATISFTLSTLINGSMTYGVYKNKTFGAWSEPLLSKTVTVSGSTTVSAGIGADSLDECENVLTVIATDVDGQRGRNAITIFKDGLPPAPSFSLGFKNREIIVSFTAKDPCDLDRYEIFYGSSVLASPDYATISAKYDKKNIDNPSDGKNYNVSISDLKNGVRYYVYLVIFDQSGNSAVSGPKSVVPQPEYSLSDLAGEEGGVDCLGSVSGERRGDARSAALLLVPLLAAAGLSVLLRRRR